MDYTFCWTKPSVVLSLPSSVLRWPLCCSPKIRFSQLWCSPKTQKYELEKECFLYVVQQACGMVPEFKIHYHQFIRKATLSQNSESLISNYSRCIVQVAIELTESFMLPHFIAHLSSPDFPGNRMILSAHFQNLYFQPQKIDLKQKLTLPPINQIEIQWRYIFNHELNSENLQLENLFQIP